MKTVVGFGFKFGFGYVLVSTSQLAAGFLASAAAASRCAALASTCRSGRCDLLRMKLTGAERSPWLLPLSEPAQNVHYRVCAQLALCPVDGTMHASGHERRRTSGAPQPHR